MPPLPFRVDPADPRPIWRQIEEGIVHAVTRGDFAVGSPVPSVRDLAKQLRVNPNTVVKVYQHLAEQGLLEVRRGEGTFVARLPDSMAPRARSRALTEAAEQFASRAILQGSSAEEILAAVEHALAEFPARKEAR
ncbi:MAG: GntR family transcriptional regulator [Acidobacteriota bacterium]